MSENHGRRTAGNEPSASVRSRTFAGIRNAGGLAHATLSHVPPRSVRKAALLGQSSRTGDVWGRWLPEVWAHGRRRVTVAAGKTSPVFDLINQKMGSQQILFAAGNGCTITVSGAEST